MKAAAPRVSVLLPCRNAAHHLRDCLISLSTQTFTDFEIIAIDDGSTDRTASILEDWARADE